MAHEIPFQGVRVRYDSPRSFDDVVAALLADIGRQPVPIAAVTQPCDDWDNYRATVEKHIGPSGFMLFAMIDHGTWLPNAGIERRALRVILGNPLIAITMLRHDMTAGLFAPVELLILDEADGSSLTYVKPSSLMVVEPNPELLSAAEQLDAKLAALADSVTLDSERGTA
jgi:uncharacterized protein (DUF302 family)